MSDQDRTPPPAPQQAPQPEPAHQTAPTPAAAQPPQQAQPTQAAPKKGPEDTLRDHELKATIWKNRGQKRDFYSTELARTYEDRNGNLRDSHSFSGDQLLRISELAKGAYHRTNELKREQRQAQERDPRTDPDRDARRDGHRAERRAQMEQYASKFHDRNNSRNRN